MAWHLQGFCHSISNPVTSPSTCNLMIKLFISLQSTILVDDEAHSTTHTPPTPAACPATSVIRCTERQRPYVCRRPSHMLSPTLIERGEGSCTFPSSLMAVAAIQQRGSTSDVVAFATRFLNPPFPRARAEAQRQEDGNGFS